MPFTVGETIGPYKLTEKLGQGGMATVFKAYHAVLDRYVAIKVLHPALLEDASFLGRFQREARTVARLEHPNIVPIYDYAEREGRPYLVMKYIEGETLKARLSSEGITDQEVRQIVQAVGSALSYAHKQKVLHRDIKPSNVLLAKDGRIYLADFGLARMAQSGESSLTADHLVGTPQYMSPEQAQGRSEIDVRSDVYSMGVMLYEIMVGNVPFNSDTPFAIIHDHIYTPLPLPREQNPTVPEAVERVLLKALAKDPKDRFDDIDSTVDAFCKALDNVVIPLEIPKSTPQDNNISSDTSPIPIKPEQAAAADAVPTDFISNDSDASASPPVSESFEVRRKKQRRTIGIILGVLLIMTLACLIYGNRVLHAIQTRAQEGTPLAFQATISEVIEAESTPFPTTDLQEANMMLDAAIESWRNGNMSMASAQLDRMLNASGRNYSFYLNMVQKTGEEGAWILAAMAIFDLDDKAFNQMEANNEMLIHEVLYKAAKDNYAGAFFLENIDNPYFVVAPIRYDLYHKEPQIAKTNLGPLLTNQMMISDFPEIKLLEVELFIELKNYERANEDLDNLLATPNLPKWIMTEAQILKSIINTNTN